ncbi:MAG: type II toxin-antitoxin system Phd/YefM family antitoxin [Actinobacteria bacterium ATB1]|nr:type II toxin-antitoxin system Phd/YefM family antitoxin [Actinobacteria bacterium ATB1]
MGVTVGVHEAKTNLLSLLQRVAGGEEVVITRSGVPIARISAITEGERRVFGQDRGRLAVPDDFDAPLPDDLLDEFES